MGQKGPSSAAGAEEEEERGGEEEEQENGEGGAGRVVGWRDMRQEEVGVSLA